MSRAPSARPHPSTDRLIPIAILLAGLALLSHNLTGPFIGHHEWNSAMHGLFARNHLRHGFDDTQLFPIWNLEAQPTKPHRRYLHHPPLLPVFGAASMAVFGEREYALRLVPIAATLGSAWLLMHMTARLACRPRAWLTGALFLALPVTAYFGRVFDHVAPTQFLSLLMLHGYLAWSGRYGEIRAEGASPQTPPIRAVGASPRTPPPSGPDVRARRDDSGPGLRARQGRLWYTVGIVLGVATGWAAWILAGLIAFWHALQRRSTPRRPLGLAALIAVPLAAMLAVALHLLWGNEWDVTMFIELARSRIAGSVANEGIEQAGWWGTQGRYLISNFTASGVIAAVACPIVRRLRHRSNDLRMPVGWRPRLGGQPNHGPSARHRLPTSDSPEPDESPRRASPHAVYAVLLAQGVLYVAAFPRQAWIHDYWQIFAAPYVAFALADLLVGAYGWVRSVRPGAAAPIGALIVLAVLIPSVRSWLRLHEGRQISPHYVQAYSALQSLIPPFAPVMVSRDWYGGGNGTGQDRRRRPHPMIAYYADRPLHHELDLDRIERNQAGCAAYVLEYEKTEEVRRLFEGMFDRYPHVSIGGHHLIFRLDREAGSPAPTQPPDGSDGDTGRQ